MRISIPIVVLACLSAIAVTWWLGTKDKDFLTPPRDLVTSDLPDPTAPQPPQPDPGKTKPGPAGAENPEDEQPVPLDTFADQAAMGPSHLADLAKNMERAKWSHLAWLAWERVIDSTNASNEEIRAAQEAIATLSKTPSASTRVILPATPYPITLQAGTATRIAKDMEPLMQSAAKTMEESSGGILSVKAKLSTGSDPSEPTEFTPVALWITGPDDASRSSEVISFTTGPGVDSEKKFQFALTSLLRTLIQKPLSKPPEAASESSLQGELDACFTRYAWQSLGAWMNTPVEAPPAATPQAVESP